MEESYTTVLDSKEVLVVVKRSKFIGNMKFVRTKEQAEEYILKIKNKYKDATHNVVAYNLKNSGIIYYSDDREPHGTAGKPILDILIKRQIFDVCVVVTRYFGGVLLGTGGLCLAYSSCCKKILEESTLAKCSLCSFLKLTFNYKYLKKIESVFLAYNVKKMKKEYLEEVNFLVIVEKKNYENLKKAVLEATNGDIEIKLEKEDWERIEF